MGWDYYCFDLFPRGSGNIGWDFNLQSYGLLLEGFLLIYQVDKTNSTLAPNERGSWSTILTTSNHKTFS